MTRHNRLRHHMNRIIKVGDTNLYSCREAAETAEHELQNCQRCDTLQQSVCNKAVDMTTKLYGPFMGWTERQPSLPKPELHFYTKSIGEQDKEEEEALGSRLSMPIFPDFYGSLQHEYRASQDGHGHVVFGFRLCHHGDKPHDDGHQKEGVDAILQGAAVQVPVDGERLHQEEACIGYVVKVCSAPVTGEGRERAQQTHLGQGSSEQSECYSGVLLDQHVVTAVCEVAIGKLDWDVQHSDQQMGEAKQSQGENMGRSIAKSVCDTQLFLVQIRPYFN
ncbi:hypothetical protein ElyMa_001506700 [Elysia marginata]|uniref:Uncharacterized protein n=1 Tax=Elysia marginata TaxID=1093978 RepID=A0AAV4J565_9GAST|nr:hypothetical protein ElyMa_001506700 [Elysia marginata]